MKRRVTWSTRSGQFSAVQFMCSEPAFMLSLGVRLRFRDMLVGWGQVWGADVCDGDFTADVGGGKVLLSRQQQQ